MYGVRCLLQREVGASALRLPRVWCRLEQLGRRLPVLLRGAAWREWAAQQRQRQQQQQSTQTDTMSANHVPGSVGHGEQRQPGASSGPAA